MAVKIYNDRQRTGLKTGDVLLFTQNTTLQIERGGKKLTFDENGAQDTIKTEKFSAGLHYQWIAEIMATAAGLAVVQVGTGNEDLIRYELL